MGNRATKCKMEMPGCSFKEGNNYYYFKRPSPEGARYTVPDTNTNIDMSESYFNTHFEIVEEPIPDSAKYSKVNLLNCDDPIMLRKEVIASHRVVVDLKEENKTLRENLCQLERVHKESDSAHLAGQVNDILHANTEAYRKKNETLQKENELLKKNMGYMLKRPEETIKAKGRLSVKSWINSEGKPRINVWFNENEFDDE